MTIVLNFILLPSQQKCQQCIPDHNRCHTLQRFFSNLSPKAFTGDISRSSQKGLQEFQNKED